MIEQQVRLATEADEEEIVRLMAMMVSESGLMPFDEATARAMIARAFHRQGGVLGVIGEVGNIKAMIFLLISKFWYTEAYHLEELFNFVRPDHRKTDYAKQMIAFAKRCSDNVKLPLIIGVLTNERMEGKVRLYRRNLGYPAGAFFVYNGWCAEASNEDFWKSPFPGKAKAIAVKELST
jgi:hypothetical protein